MTSQQKPQTVHRWIMDIASTSTNDVYSAWGAGAISISLPKQPLVTITRGDAILKRLSFTDSQDGRSKHTATRIFEYGKIIKNQWTEQNMLSPRACTGVGISTGRKIFDSWNVRNLRMRGMGSQVELSQEMKKIGKNTCYSCTKPSQAEAAQLGVHR